MNTKIWNPKGKIPSVCDICGHREGNLCHYHEIDVTREQWLRESDGCNANTEGVGTPIE